LHRIFRADAFDRLVGHHGLGFAAVRHAIVVFAFLGAIRRLGAGLFRLRRSGGFFFRFLFFFLAARVVGLLLQQRFAVRNRDLVIVGMDFAEGEEAMPVTAIF